MKSVFFGLLASLLVSGLSPIVMSVYAQAAESNTDESVKLEARTPVVGEKEANGQVANTLAPNEAVNGEEDNSIKKPVNQVQRVLDLLNTDASEAEFSDKGLKEEQRVGEVNVRYHASAPLLTGHEGALTPEDAAPSDAAAAGTR